MLVLDPLRQALSGEASHQIPSSNRISQDPRGTAQLPSNDEISSTTTTSYNIEGGNNQQIYVNEYPQYDPNLSYHGYDLSRDVSEYKFGADNGPNHGDVANRPIPPPRKSHSNQTSDDKIVNTKADRGQWTGRFDFFFSSLGYAVGLGAIWRFPYLCYRNGGGVFLIPYFIFLFLLGIPLFYLETSLGQFTSQGVVQCWRMAPIFKGLGISMSLISFFMIVYYAMLVGYSILYFVLSFRSKLEWATCGAWAGPNCTDDFSTFVMRCNYENTYKDPNGRCYTWTNQGLTQIGWWNIESRIQYRKPVLPSDDYFNNFILNKSQGIGYISTMEWPLVLSLLAAWVLVFACLCRGIKLSGKVVYFTSIFPYVILLILGIRGWTLPGCGRGIYFYMKPDLSRLADGRVWNDAANQIFFVLSVSYGGLITLSSYNKFNQKILGNTITVCLANILTSIFAGFVIFAYLGYLSYITGQDVENVVSEGPGLAFIVYPYAVTTLPAAPLWSILFFLMLILLGLDSMFASVETIVAVITDQIHALRRYHTLITLIICISAFGLGLLLCTDAGIYWITFLDQFNSSYPAFTIGILECICIAYVYGSNNFRKDIKAMVGPKNMGVRVFRLFQICWMFITPIIILALIIFTSINFPALRLGNYNFPHWSYKLGWCLVALILSGTVFYALYAIIHFVLIDRNTYRVLINPEPQWGPLLEQNRKKVNYYHGGHKGVLVSVIDRLKNRTLSRETLARSKSTDIDIADKESSIFAQRPPSRVGSESAV
ncbi:unnamed protein product [Adineta steineri]|uniref:Transporter n=1 Tax=Adineta steineri TaxID=433720 RepID=A0A815GPI8_9BILA|nr:unnamed protein product [Adineta steineri]CAF1341683.1 unnamed protein product [Adineta steineri]CAF3532510.1 unnamed protein product [Adineta steineri]CAF3704792.1 unnamed protein product [Adineta steineri]